MAKNDTVIDKSIVLNCPGAQELVWLSAGGGGGIIETNNPRRKLDIGSNLRKNYCP